MKPHTWKSDGVRRSGYCGKATVYTCSICEIEIEVRDTETVESEVIELSLSKWSPLELDCDIVVVKSVLKA